MKVIHFIDFKGKRQDTDSSYTRGDGFIAGWSFYNNNQLCTANVSPLHSNAITWVLKKLLEVLVNVA